MKVILLLTLFNLILNSLDQQNKEKEFEERERPSYVVGDNLYQPKISLRTIKINENIPYIDYKIKIPQEIEKVLSEYDPNFIPFDSERYSSELLSFFPFTYYNTPSVVIGDFNGDNKMDIFLVGSTIINDRKEKEKIGINFFYVNEKIKTLPVEVEKEIMIISSTSGYIARPIKKMTPPYSSFEGKRNLWKIPYSNYYNYEYRKRSGYLFQPGKSAYLLGGSTKMIVTHENDFFVEVKVEDNKIYFESVFLWDENENKLQQFVYKKHYYIPAYFSKERKNPAHQ
ncbi:MAG: hypothetical protein K6357_03485 [Elusimicrobiota bacterium]